MTRMHAYCPAVFARVVPQRQSVHVRFCSRTEAPRLLVKKASTLAKNGGRIQARHNEDNTWW